MRIFVIVFWIEKLHWQYCFKNREFYTVFFKDRFILYLHSFSWGVIRIPGDGEWPNADGAESTRKCSHHKTAPSLHCSPLHLQQGCVETECSERGKSSLFDFLPKFWVVLMFYSFLLSDQKLTITLCQNYLNHWLWVGDGLY